MTAKKETTKKKGTTTRKTATKKKITPKVILAFEGEEETYEVSEITPELLRKKAIEAGIGKFVVTVNGFAIESPSDFPALVGKEYIKILPYDRWAL
ncbi:MAG: hypothetical protein KAU20_05670 [Nanoarchaeota archaeon]|nr:hypothetical protein [Nanoarchaeota archaeon]